MVLYKVPHSIGPGDKENSGWSVETPPRKGNPGVFGSGLAGPESPDIGGWQVGSLGAEGTGGLESYYSRVSGEGKAVVPLSPVSTTSE